MNHRRKTIAGRILTCILLPLSFLMSCGMQDGERVPEKIITEQEALAQAAAQQNAAEQNTTQQSNAEDSTAEQSTAEQSTAEESATTQTVPVQTVPVSDPAAYTVLLGDLVAAYENPSPETLLQIDADAEAIAEPLAKGIADCWKRYYLDPEYRLLYYGRDEVTLLSVPQEQAHAFVLPGYELKNGEISEELKGRCDAAAEAAKAFPDTLLICTGGVTGRNNPEQYTEAGRMKEYLTETCGIAPERILTEEDAMNTAENALNVYAMLRAHDVRTFTIITSSYHQQWAQFLYAVVGLIVEEQTGYRAKLTGNYCFETEPEYRSYRAGHRYAVRQLADVLWLPAEEIMKLPEILY